MRCQLRSVHLAWVLTALCTGLAAGWGCSSGGDGATPAGTCGNSAVEAGEQCDGDAPQACTASCGTTGTQACVSCAWATCAPPAEICNGADDDCDGVADQGLASVEVELVGTAPALAMYGNAGGGVLYPDSCPPGEVAIGFSGELTTGNFLGGIRTHCGDPSVACAGSSCTVTVATGSTLPLRGAGVGGGTFSSLCPADQVVVGFGGRSGLLVDRLVIRCAPLVVAAPGTDWVVGVGTSVDLDPAGGSGGTPFAQTDCPEGDVATAGVIRAGDGVDAFTVACQTPTKSCAGVCGNAVAEWDEQCDGDAPRACTASCGTTGTQACVSCAWEATCAPPAEICNGADDDCDGVADQGLASVEVDFVGAPDWRGVIGATNLGSFYEDACPAGEAAIGFDGELTTSGYVGAIRLRCGNPRVSCADSSCTVGLDAGASLPLRGTGTGGGTFSALCGADGVISGFGGWFDGGSVNVISGLVFRCASIDVTPPGTEWTVALGSPADLTPGVGGTTGNQGRIDCATGQAATSAVIRAGNGVHALGISCRTPAKACP